MIEMLPREYLLQIHAEIQAILPQLQEEVRAEQEQEQERANQERRRALSADYDRAIAKKAAKKNSESTRRWRKKQKLTHQEQTEQEIDRVERRRSQMREAQRRWREKQQINENNINLQ